MSTMTKNAGVSTVNTLKALHIEQESRRVVGKNVFECLKNGVGRKRPTYKQKP